MPNHDAASYPSLAARHVLVTGGADGIGAALVESFCRQHAVVTFFDIDDDLANDTVERISALGLSRPQYRRCDVTDTSALQAEIALVVAECGPIHVLINNAANDERHNWACVTSTEWDRLMDVNLKHHFFAIQAVAPGMASSGGGSIINMSSISWQLGMGGMPCYVAAKSAIIGLTRSFARDLGGLNIRVNTVLPGWIMTRRQIDLHKTPEGVTKLLASQCLKRELTPEDLAPMVLFLASDDSRACTNQSFVVDGGWI
ncbi:MAG: SDR family oxidoreductase [Burkholderiales bacterium]|nr:SDR family oxidoreductase [Anaerolineae bacterium]